MKRLCLVLLILIVTLTGCSAANRQPPAATADAASMPDAITVTGYDSPLKLGMDISLLKKSFDMVKKSYISYDIKDTGIEVLISEKVTVDTITIRPGTSSGYTLFGGITDGSSLAELKAAWGEPTELGDSRTGFYFDSSGKPCQKADAQYLIVAWYTEDTVVGIILMPNRG